MILALLFLVGAAALLVLAWHALRASGEGSRPRLRVENDPGRGDAPSLRLEAGGATILGPVAADWSPPAAVVAAFGPGDGQPGRLGAPVQAGAWRVGALVDLSAPDVLGTGATGLDKPLRNALGRTVMVLERVGGDAPPILLHGRGGRVEGSVAGIALEHARFTALTKRLGDEVRALEVVVVRRRIQRTGWGTQRAQRRRSVG